VYCRPFNFGKDIILIDPYGGAITCICILLAPIKLNTVTVRGADDGIPLECLTVNHDRHVRFCTILDLAAKFRLQSEIMTHLSLNSWMTK
jgi:hypothetical protein